MAINLMFMLGSMNRSWAFFSFFLKDLGGNILKIMMAYVIMFIYLVHTLMVASLSCASMLKKRLYCIVITTNHYLDRDTLLSVDLYNIFFKCYHLS